MMPSLDGNHPTPLMMGLIPLTDNSNEGNTDLKSTKFITTFLDEVSEYKTIKKFPDVLHAI